MEQIVLALCRATTAGAISVIIKSPSDSARRFCTLISALFIFGVTSIIGGFNFPVYFSLPLLCIAVLASTLPNKMSVAKRLVCTISIPIVLAVTMLVSLISMSFATSYPVDEILEYSPVCRCGAYCMTAMLMMFAAETLVKIKSDKKIKLYHLLSIGVFCGFMCVLLITTFAVCKTDYIENLYLVYISILLCSLLFAYGDIKACKIRALEQETRIKTLQTVALNEAIARQDEIKRMHHDMKHYVLGVQSLLNTDNNQKLSDFLAEINGELEKSDYFNCQNTALSAIINSKMTLAKSQDITLQAMIEDNILSLSDIELYTLFGNILDNAIENSPKSSVIQLRIFSDSGFANIEIKNNCSSDADFSNTSKKDKKHHGIGLKSAEKVVRNHNGIFSAEICENIATVRISIPLSD